MHNITKASLVFQYSSESRRSVKIIFYPSNQTPAYQKYMDFILFLSYQRQIGSWMSFTTDPRFVNTLAPSQLPNKNYSGISRWGEGKNTIISLSYQIVYALIAIISSKSRFIIIFIGHLRSLCSWSSPSLSVLQPSWRYHPRLYFPFSL